MNWFDWIQFTLFRPGLKPFKGLCCEFVLMTGKRTEMWRQISHLLSTAALLC